MRWNLHCLSSPEVITYALSVFGIISTTHFGNLAGPVPNLRKRQQTKFFELAVKVEFLMAGNLIEIFLPNAQANPIESELDCGNHQTVFICLSFFVQRRQLKLEAMVQYFCVGEPHQSQIASR